MNANEMYEYVKKHPFTEDLLQEIVNWCIEHHDSINLNSDNEYMLYTYAVSYLFKLKLRHLSKDEAKLIISFLAAEQIFYQKDDNYTIKVKILDEEEYKKRYNKSNATCVVNNQDELEIVYSEKVVDNLRTNDITPFFKAIRTIYHECVHAMQRQLIKKGLKPDSCSVTAYKIAAEMLICDTNHDFYTNNYEHLLMEKQAEYYGFNQAFKTIKRFNESLFDKYNPQKMEIMNNNLKRKLEEASIIVDDEEMKRSVGINKKCDEVVLSQPEYLDYYPILRINYNDDGSRKSITSILNDRISLIESGFNQEDLDRLVLYILNNRSYIDIDANIQELKEYIISTGGTDRLAYDILYDRMNKAQMTDEERMEVLTAINKRKVA